MPSLIVTGPEHATPRRIRFSETPFHIGRSLDNDLVLSDPSVSKKHCCIILQAGKLTVQDLNSRSGTLVNDRRIKKTTQLHRGDRLTVGRYKIEILSDDESGDTWGATAHEESQERAAPASSALAVNEINASARQRIRSRIRATSSLADVDKLRLSPREFLQRITDLMTPLVQDILGAVALDENSLVSLLNEAIGFGPLDKLLSDESIDEIMVNNYNAIYVESGGKIRKTTAAFSDTFHLMNVVRRILAPVGRHVDEASPMVDARLPDGSRINVIIPPLSVIGPLVTIRKFGVRPFTMSDLVSRKTLTRNMAAFLKLCMQQRMNIIVSGGTGSGKTTLLNVLSSFISNHERIITIEDAAELRLNQPHVLPLEAKPPDSKGRGAITIRELLANSLRMRPDRIIIGECRGGEALDMLQAMNTGHDGSLTSLHANSPRDALNRLETLVLMAGIDLPARAIRKQIASAINLIVQQNRFPDGSRKITSITEVTGMEGDMFSLNEIFRFEERGPAKSGKVNGEHKATGAIPTFVLELRSRGVPVNLDLFKEGQ